MKLKNFPETNIEYPPYPPVSPKEVEAAERAYMQHLPRRWAANLSAAAEEAESIDDLRQIVFELCTLLANCDLKGRI